MNRYLVLALVGGLVAALGVSHVANAAPLSSAGLTVSATMVGGGGSYYNPRSAGGKNYVGEISNPYTVTQFATGSSTAEVGPVATTEHRMTTSFQAGGTDYVLSSAGASHSNFTLRDYGDLSAISTTQSS